MEKKIMIHTPFIKLDAALKLSNAVSTGGEAKSRIADGEVRVNGEVCTMRGKKLYPGDTVEIQEESYRIFAYGSNGNQSA